MRKPVPKLSRKPRIFISMLLAFVLVIVLGICGMLGFVAMTVIGAWQPMEWRDALQTLQQTNAQTLADYYVAHGDSWDGVDARLSANPIGGPVALWGYTLADADGQVIASNEPNVAITEQMGSSDLARGTAIRVDDQQVGTLLLQRMPGSLRMRPSTPKAPLSPSTPIVSSSSATPALLPVLKGFFMAGLALASVLIVLAAIFAQRLSRPIRGITAAAQSLAAGDLDTQAPGARVRELDDLASAFNEMAHALKLADRQRRQMTADIAHELRTPLTIIKGRLEGLQDGVYSATPAEIDRLLGEVALLERLIDDLRLLALAEAGQLQLYTEMLDPAEILAGSAQSFAGQAAAQGVELRCALPDALPPIVADSQRLSQVFANLIANALRFTPAGGAITLDARALGPGDTWPAGAPALWAQGHPTAVLFRIADTGAGIDPADLPQIFDRFYRADRSRARGSGGAGLGLAIARQIVATHGGEIWAESSVGQGTTILILLPQAGPAGALAQQPEQLARV